MSFYRVKCSILSAVQTKGMEVTVESKILIGNAFPMTLVRGHRVVVEDVPVAGVVSAARCFGVQSFWGHENTRSAAESILGICLRPKTPRPALVLGASNYPTLDGESFRMCYVLSPDYKYGFRPAIGEEVRRENIRGWHALKLTWED